MGDPQLAREWSYKAEEDFGFALGCRLFCIRNGVTPTRLTVFIGENFHGEDRQD